MAIQKSIKVKYGFIYNENRKTYYPVSKIMYVKPDGVFCRIGFSDNIETILTEEHTEVVLKQISGWELNNEQLRKN